MTYRVTADDGQRKTIERTHRERDSYGRMVERVSRFAITAPQPQLIADQEHQ